MIIQFQPWFRNENEYQQVEITFYCKQNKEKGYHNGQLPLVMIERVWYTVGFHGVKTEYATLLFSTDWLWRKPLYWLKKKFCKKNTSVNELLDLDEKPY
jgi:hypothetical protein